MIKQRFTEPVHADNSWFGDRVAGTLDRLGWDWQDSAESSRCSVTRTRSLRGHIAEAVIRAIVGVLRRPSWKGFLATPEYAAHPAYDTMMMAVNGYADI
jgi:hypothetical protein